MARVNLEIRFDEPQRRYGPREPIVGIVQVEVQKATRCDGLELFFTETIHSPHADRTTEHDRRQRLFTGDWAPGSYEYAFEIPGPRWPPSYRGGMLEWQWMLSARADIPLAIDPVAHAPIDVVIAPEDGLTVVHKNPGDPSKVAGSNRTARIALLFAAACAVAGGVGYFVDTQLLAAGIGFGVIALLVAGYQWGKVSEIGAPQLAVEHVAESPDTLRCTLHIKSAADVHRIECVFAIVETQVVRTGAGSNRSSRTYTHEVIAETFRLEESDEGTYRADLSLPERSGLPYSRMSGGSSLGWTVIPTVHLNNGMHYELPAGVLWALPARGPAAQS